MSTVVADPSPWLRVEQAAEYCRVHKSVIFRAARDHRIEHCRISGRGTLLFKREWCDNWLASLTVHVKAVA